MWSSIKARCWILPLALLCACRPAERSAVIGLAYNTAEQPNPLRTVVEAALDSLSSAGGWSLRLVQRPADGLEAVGGAEGWEIGGVVTYATRLRDVPGIVGVVGHPSSRESLAAAPVYHEAGLVQMVPTGTSRLLDGRWPRLFRLAPTDSIEGRFIGRYLTEAIEARRVVILHITGEYGTGLLAGVETALAGGPTEVMDRIAIPADEPCPEGTAGTGYVRSLNRVAAIPSLDAVVVAGRNFEAGCVARGLSERGVEIPVVAGDGAFPGPRLRESAGAALERIHMVAFWHPDASGAASSAFVARWRALTGSDPSAGDAMAYDGVLLLAHAVREVGDSTEEIAAYLRSLGDTRPPFEGVSGPIGFGPQAERRLFMVGARGGTAVLLEEQAW